MAMSKPERSLRKPKPDAMLASARLRAVLSTIHQTKPASATTRATWMTMLRTVGLVSSEEDEDPPEARGGIGWVSAVMSASPIDYRTAPSGSHGPPAEAEGESGGREGPRPPRVAHDQRIGMPYWMPPSVQSAFMPRWILSGVFMPMLRSKISP